MPAAGIVPIAVLSDLHANREATRACLDHARAHGATRFVFLGDYVGYGADAAAVADLVMEHVADGALAVQGNHDAALDRRQGFFNEAAVAALDWARQELAAAHRAFLADLPLILRDDACCWVHASAARPERWDYVDSTGAAQRCIEASARPYTFCGHVHDQMLYFESARGHVRAFRPTPGRAVPVARHRRWLAVVGSVGQPRDRNPAAGYVLFDEGARTIVFHRVPYDAPSAARRIRECGLPESLAFRVELGI